MPLHKILKKITFHIACPHMRRYNLPMRFLRYSLIFSGLLIAGVCAAQVPSADDLQPVKMDITEAILEHGRLQQDNIRLKDEFESLKIEYDRRLKELQVSGESERLKNAALQNKLDSRAISQKSAEELGADLMIKETQIAHLKVALMDLEEQEHLWKLKVTDAEYQKQTLELELAVQQNHYEQQAGAYVSRIDQLNRAILRNRIEEKELLVQYALLEDEAGILDNQQRIFDNENAYLKKEAVNYQGLQEKAKVESDASTQAQALEQQKLDQVMQDKQKQKVELERQLQIVRQQHTSLDAQLTQALKQLEERQQLTDNITHLKADNERLQSAITSLQSQAEEITP